MPHHRILNDRFMKVVDILRRYGEHHPHAHYMHPFPDDHVRESLLQAGFSEEDMQRLADRVLGARIHGRFGISEKMLRELHKLLFR